MNDLLLNYTIQILLTVGVIVIFGLLISMLRKIFCRIAGGLGYWVLLISGLVGTPVHELSHALMCVIFRHRIDEMRLYDPKNPDGTLGYVRHSYNKKSIYQNIGHFFIGTAPITCGGLVILLLMYLLAPSTYADVVGSFGEGFSVAGLTVGQVAADYALALWGTAKVIFRAENFSSAAFWIFIVLAIMISSHMELSFSDIRSGFVGFLLLGVLLLLADLIMWWLFPSALVAFTESLGAASLRLAGFLGIAVIFLLALVLIALIIRIPVSIIKRR